MEEFNAERFMCWTSRPRSRLAVDREPVQDADPQHPIHERVVELSDDVPAPQVVERLIFQERLDVTVPLILKEIVGVAMPQRSN